MALRQLFSRGESSLRSHFHARGVPIGKCHAVDTFVQMGQTMVVYKRREIEREAPQVEAVRLVRAYVCVRIYALMAAI
jgi:hypothetical protein